MVHLIGITLLVLAAELAGVTVMTLALRAYYNAKRK